MQDVINKLVFSIFKKEDLKECSAEELKFFAREYPFYSFGHLLYSSKLKETGNEEYKNEIQKTSLYFNNPLWLDLLVTNSICNPDISIKVNELLPESFEDFNNDELVVENPRPEIFSEKPLIKENITEQIQVQATERTEPAFVFEPYHTVDYFASQGIKPAVEEKPKDKFGQQLKSFTEWLKVLKTTPAQQLNNTTEKIAEEQVTTLAVHSIEDRNVETEAMAEVWIKQGQAAKAIAIYHKLSLLNPSKSSYFATLIDSLK